MDLRKKIFIILKMGNWLNYKTRTIGARNGEDFNR